MVDWLDGSLWVGDCLELMRDIPDGSVDMVITSPPYDDMRTYNGSLNDWTFEKFSLIAKELARVTKDGGVIVWNVGDATVGGSETGSSFRQTLYFIDECRLKLNDTMIWNKGAFNSVGALKYRYGQVFEYMFVFTKGKHTFNPIKDRANKYAGTKMHGTKRLPDGSMIPIHSNGKIISEYGIRFNIWDMNADRKGEHPAAFPVSLAHDHIVSWSNPSDLILDPFAGSGTTAIAARRTSRRFICIEREWEYAIKAACRISGEPHVTQ